MNIKELNEELEKFLEESEKINGLKLIPHGEQADKNYKKAFEYFKNNTNKIKRGFINIPVSELGLSDNETKTLGYEFK